MQQLQQRMLAEIERFSPEALMKNWLAVGPQGVEQMQGFFRGKGRARACCRALSADRVHSGRVIDGHMYH